MQRLVFWRLASLARRIDLYGLLLQAGRSSEVALGPIQLPVLSTHRHAQPRALLATPALAVKAEGADWTILGAFHWRREKEKKNDASTRIVNSY